MIFHALAVRNTARWSPALFEKPQDARHDWQIASALALRIRARRAAAKPDPSRLGLAKRMLHKAIGLPGAIEAQARFRTTPKQQVDVLLRTGRRGLSVATLAQTPGGVDLGPLQPQLPGRLHTKNKRIDLAVPLVLDALPALLDAAPVTTEGDLLLVGRRSQRDGNSWMHNLPRLTSGRPRHRLLIHPDDAATRDISDGDVVEVTSSTGKVRIDTHVSDEMMPGVVSLPHGYGHAMPGVQLRNATTLPGVSINDLTDPERTESIGANAVLNGIPVTIQLVPPTAARTT